MIEKTEENDGIDNGSSSGSSSSGDKKIII
jgi:hypothetical protein